MSQTSRQQIRVCEIFRSIQGETSLAGLPATFLRLAGCNLRCSYCDSEYAHAPGAPVSVSELLASLARTPQGRARELVVVTGGEPLIQVGTRDLLSELVRAGHRVVLETNGSLDIDGLPPQVIRVVDVKCPGSGESEKIRWQILDKLRPTDEVKLVLTDRADFDFAVDVIDRHELERRCTVLLSPVTSRLAPTTLAEWILSRGGSLRLQLQLHRVLWPGRHRGV